MRQKRPSRASASMNYHKQSGRRADGDVRCMRDACGRHLRSGLIDGRVLVSSMNTRGIRNASPSGRSRVLAGKNWEFATHTALYHAIP
jgi:hypothetical protein